MTRAARRGDSPRDGFRVNRTRRADAALIFWPGEERTASIRTDMCPVKSGKSRKTSRLFASYRGAKEFWCGPRSGRFLERLHDAVYAEARRAFFQIRLWDADD